MLLFLSYIILSAGDKVTIPAGIRIWEPAGRDRAGHVSIFTPKYYMSFFPLEDKSVTTEPVPACLHLTSNYDARKESGRKLTKCIPITDVQAVEKLEEIYVKFLKYNDVTEEDIIQKVRKGSSFIEKWKAWYAVSLSNEAGKTPNEPPAPIMHLSKTKYFLYGKVNENFHLSAQCCTTFVFCLLENAGIIVKGPLTRRLISVHNVPGLGFSWTLASRMLITGKFSLEKIRKVMKIIKPNLLIHSGPNEEQEINNNIPQLDYSNLEEVFKGVINDDDVIDIDADVINSVLNLSGDLSVIEEGARGIEQIEKQKINIVVADAE